MPLCATFVAVTLKYMAIREQRITKVEYDVRFGEVEKRVVVLEDKTATNSSTNSDHRIRIEYVENATKKIDVIQENVGKDRREIMDNLGQQRVEIAQVVTSLQGITASILEIKESIVRKERCN